VSDGAVVEVPESLGIRLREQDDEMEIVVWTGGWADVDCVLDGEATTLCPEFQDVERAYAAVA
jgi:hypothetical protein